ncbi:MAG: hypothetical protein QM817_15865 [Archangium sp.]
MMRLFSVLCVVVVACGCGPTRFQSFCERTVEASCKQAFRCKPDEAKTAFTDQAGCVTELKTRSRCASFESEMCTLDGSKTAKCLTDIDNAPCTTTVGSLPESCRSITCSTGNKCSRVSSDGSSGGCSYTLTDCTDQNSYGVQCVGSSCSCQKNGSAERTFSGTCATSSRERLTQLKTECSYDLN